MVKHAYIHPRYWLTEGLPGDPLGGTAVYDIAILRLEKTIRFSTSILPACLPHMASKEYINLTAVASGWGRTLGTADQSFLQQVDMTVLPIEKCQNITRIKGIEGLHNITNKYYLINESHTLCAGYYNASETSYEFTGIHQGDSGGSLIVQEIDTLKSTIIGVAVDGPGEENYVIEPYFQYTNVANLMPLILKTIHKGNESIFLLE